MSTTLLVAEYYHIPTRSCAAVTTSKSVDYMAAIETTQSMLSAVLGGVDLVYCCCGTLGNLITYFLRETNIG